MRNVMPLPCTNYIQTQYNIIFYAFLEYENTGLENFLPVWYEEKSIWEHLSLKKLDCVSSLFSPLLMTLARAAESESATTFIFESGLLHQLNALILRKVLKECLCIKRNHL